jgi:hypothetical protein
MFLNQFKLLLMITNMFLSLGGYQTEVDQFKTLSVSCQLIGTTVFLNVDAEIFDSALFLNQVIVTESDSIISLTFRKRLVFPSKRTFIDKTVVSTAATTSVDTSPSLNAAWRNARISLGQLPGRFYTLKVIGRRSDRVIGHCTM